MSPVAFTSQFRGAGGSYYRPLFWLSLAVDQHIWGPHGASGFHFTNVFLHWANGFLLFLFLRRLHISGVTAGATSFIWLGMPINSEAVAWVSGRAYLLCGLFLLLALYFAHSYIAREKTSYLVGAFISSLAALLSHESGLLFLPLLTLLAFATGGVSKRPARILFSVALISDLIFLSVWRLAGARSGEGTTAIWTIGLAFWKYGLWMVAPVHMSMQRATSTPPDILSLNAVVAICFVLLLCATILLLRKIAPLFAAGLAWSAVAILPFCGIVFIYQGMAERYDYLASAGLALAISSLVFEYASARAFAQGAACLVILWVAWGAWRLKLRVLDWCDPVSLYQSSLETTPDAMLFYDLGWAWREKGFPDKALAQYQEAIRRQPDYQEAQASVGQMLTVLGRPTEAVTAYNRALALSPEDSNTRVALAITLEQLGDRQGAERQFRKSLMYTPQNITSLNGLGSLLLQEGRQDEATQYFHQAIQDKPDDTTAYYNMAVLFQHAGQMDKALMFYRKVLQLNPNDPDALANMANLYR